VSVYGADQGMSVYTGGIVAFNAFPQQEVLDYLEKSLATRFTAAGMSVLPGDKVKPAFDYLGVASAINVAYGEPKPSPDEIAKFKQNIDFMNQMQATMKEMLSDKGKQLDGTRLSASANTALLGNNNTHKGEMLDEIAKTDWGFAPFYHEKFTKALGIITQDLGGDGFVLARLETHFSSTNKNGANQLPVMLTNLHLAVYNDNGELVFNDFVRITGETSVGGYADTNQVTLNFKAADVYKLTEANIDKALDQAFSDLKGGAAK
jgi:hypothetical protein